MPRLFPPFDSMLKSKNVLITGIDPDLVDYSSVPHLDAFKVFAAIELCSLFTASDLNTTSKATC
jgi:hypothetical protein